MQKKIRPAAGKFLINPLPLVRNGLIYNYIVRTSDFATVTRSEVIWTSDLHSAEIRNARREKKPSTFSEIEKHKIQ